MVVDNRSYSKGKQATAARQIEGFSEVHEGNVERLVLLAALLHELADIKYHVDYPASGLETTLSFWVYSVGESLQFWEHHSFEFLAYNTEGRDSTIVIKP